MQDQKTRADRENGRPDRGSPLRSIATAQRSLSRLHSVIGWRLLVRVLLFSSAITLVLTLMQLYLDYRRDVDAIDLRMSEIDSGYRRSLGDGLWRLDARQLQLQVEGILHLPDIRYVELREATDHAAPLVVTAGSRQANPPVRREFKIYYTNRGVDQLLGILVIEATFDQIYRQLLNTAAVILVGQGIKTFAVSFFILFIVHRLITRHLTTIATSLRRYDLQGSQPPLRLERCPPRSADELDSLVGAFNDMYARLRAAYGDLQEREAKIRRLVDANIIGILIFDFEGRIIDANEAFLRMLGFDRDDFVSGRVRWTDLIPPEWRDRAAQALGEVKTIGVSQPFERMYFRNDGSRVPVLIGAARFDEAATQGVAFVLDLTERKQAEAEARKSERRLRDAEIALAHASRVVTMGQLTASIAHEVNQPIAATIGNAEVALRWLARQSPDLEEARQLLGKIVRDGHRASSVLGRIRDLIKKSPSRMERMEINGAIGEVVELTRGEALKNGVAVQTQLAEGLPLIEADRIQLQQVMLNLIINAVQALAESAKDPREVSISTSMNGSNDVVVSVRDSGPGVSPENLGRLFDPFYTTKPTGMGMGLSICRSIIESHGGRIWITANVPRGAAFHFTIPIARQ